MVGKAQSLTKWHQKECLIKAQAMDDAVKAYQAELAKAEGLPWRGLCTICAAKSGTKSGLSFPNG